MAQIAWEMSVGPLAVIEFDATPTEQHGASAVATQHPVEEGVNMTDHVKPNLRTVTLEGVITNTPLNETTIGTMFPIGAILGAPTPFVLSSTRKRKVTQANITGGIPSQFRFPGFPRGYVPGTATPTLRADEPIVVTGSGFRSPVQEDRVKACYDALIALCLEGRKVTLITNIEEYPVMVITNVSAPIRAEDAIRFSIELQQVKFATTKNVDIKRKKPREKRAETEQNLGPSAAFVPPDPKGQTLIIQGADKLSTVEWKNLLGS